MRLRRDDSAARQNMVEFENGPTPMMMMMMMMTTTMIMMMMMITAVGPTYQGRMGTIHERRK